MDSFVNGPNGECLRCDGTKKCHSCKGEGKIVPRGKTIMSLMTCPTCKGAGICIFCKKAENKKAVI